MTPPVVRTYLEMLTPPPEPVGSAPAGARLTRPSPCPISLYRALYDGVGGPWQWYERRAWSDEALRAHLDRPEVDVVVFEVGDRLAGYYELVRHPDGSTEIGYFGLMPDQLGRGLGSWLLRTAIAHAWEAKPSRVWLHTCTLDHPAALPNYLRRGFRVVRTEAVAPPPSCP